MAFFVHALKRTTRYLSLSLSSRNSTILILFYNDDWSRLFCFFVIITLSVPTINNILIHIDLFFIWRSFPNIYQDETKKKGVLSLKYPIVMFVVVVAGEHMPTMILWLRCISMRAHHQSWLIRGGKDYIDEKLICFWFRSITSICRNSFQALAYVYLLKENIFSEKELFTYRKKRFGYFIIIVLSVGFFFS